MASLRTSSLLPMISSVLLLFLLAPLGHAGSTANQPRPYKVNVDKKLIEDTRLRASNFRQSFNIDAPAWFDGPPGANISQISKYWANSFDFARFQNEINTNFTQYMTTVPPPGGRYNRSLDLYFIHQVSKRKDAIPLLLVHGWPSTSLEWAKVIPDLVSPPNSSLPAFHVVAPDLPGFGFSPSATAPGLGAAEHSAALASLMSQLGYDRFVLYSTDLGYLISRRMVPAYSQRIINHVSDFFIVPPNATDVQRLANTQTTPEETAYMTAINNEVANYAGYAGIHDTLPLSLAYALNDSPVGFLAWVMQVVYTFGDVNETPEELIRRTLPLYLPGPYGNIRAYKELYQELFTFPGIKSSVPTSAIQWHGADHYPSIADVTKVPRDWIQRTANLTFFRQHPVGGHFPAQTQPRLWIEDIWAIFARKA